MFQFEIKVHAKISPIRQVSPQEQETEFDGPPLQKQKRIIYFSSGESLELEDSEEDEAEEQKSHRTSFEEPKKRVGICSEDEICLHIKTGRSCDRCVFLHSEPAVVQECCHSSWEDVTAGYVAPQKSSD